MNLLLEPSYWTPDPAGVWDSNFGEYHNDGANCLVRMLYIGPAWAPGDTIEGVSYYDDQALSSGAYLFFTEDTNTNECIPTQLHDDDTGNSTYFSFELPAYVFGSVYHLGFNTSNDGCNDRCYEGPAPYTGIAPTDDNNNNGDTCYPPVCSCTLPACVIGD